ncbi:hypothetical protein D1646_00435 [Pseudoflavonifractor sp. 60]|mgnify:CR=1 FL=1|uniref:hypothetical protein n=1 Tax=Pseudoflavonifractor sp. 60 TaxID=2304576 RepID=UPI001370F4A9|nr:hypothetical protein [Pseudoflavonifractor sp. 60]NBI65296.1 hypothetical protein [Pseudoflavonifractor sp. 60]
MIRCISCRKDIIDFVQVRFEGFQVTLPLPGLKQDNYYIAFDPKYGELKGSVYRFVKERPEGSFCRLEVRRAFAQEKIYLQLGGILVSYLKYDWGAAQCTGKVLNNIRYGQLAQLSPKFQVESPWFLADNNPDSLRGALEQLEEWYREHLGEIQQSWDKQQGFLDRECRELRPVRRFLGEHMGELSQEDVWEVYRCVDQLAEEYKAKYGGQKHVFSAPSQTVFFHDFCYGTLPPVLNAWIEELAAALQRGKKGYDETYARKFAVTALLYLFNDMQRERWPNILEERPWTVD